MSKIYIHRQHDVGLDSARQAAEDVARHIGDTYGVDYRWEQDAIHFRRSGVDGVILIGDDFIEIDARLGLLLSMFRDAIENEINTQLDGMFGV